MADYNPDISNGTCYYANGEEAPSRFIPCGNEALGHKACCESLDMCLSSNACYNGQYGVTYLAGCTDPSYEDSRCPDKGDFADQPWAGLVYCNGTSNEWVACEDSGSTVSVPEPCWCPSSSRTVAFTDSSQLTNIMSLPNTPGASVTWRDVLAYESEHSLTLTSSPTTTSDSSSVTTLLPPVSARTTNSSVTSTDSSSSESSASKTASASATPESPTESSGLRTGQKIGVGLGAAGGMIAMLLLGWLVARRLRRGNDKRRQTPPMVDLTRPQSDGPQMDADLRSPAWSGHKSELPADDSTTTSPSPAYQEFRQPQTVEVEGTPARPAARTTQDGGYKMPGDKGTYYEMPG
ncbi:hypothetical protein A1O1_08225 [Capronia coronata CBS 617.96]|uniref:Uncharacterized protein n=1 Tax=Capronia coronata CBS 617.96 TaxID=1182541 RepID=W9XYU9_9EURO|nr:uncharacterized protein A1O1_08225 [Capronia coronata CBS 617.96]EXJ82156.1 hypothetical protein A1O1_08225 [Capronia coronata CBS 617.96]